MNENTKKKSSSSPNEQYFRIKILSFNFLSIYERSRFFQLLMKTRQYWIIEFKSEALTILTFINSPESLVG